MRLKCSMILALAALAVGTASAALDFSRYDVILERMPFGEPPVERVPVIIPPIKPAQTFVQLLKVRMTAITDHPNFGVRVGFEALEEKGSKKSKSYYMSVGEMRDGFMVMEADVEKETAVLLKDGETETIAMGVETGIGSGVPGAVASTAARSPSSRPTRTIISNAPRPESASSYADRLRQRRELMKKHQENKRAPELSGEELKKHLQEYQMELIRAGGKLGPPLPIPLTREMDDKLVAEGVLPAVDE